MQTPNRELEMTTLKGFTATICHACEIKEPLEEFRDKRVLVLGGGETGSDICLDWYDFASCIYWSIPRGQHFFRKYGKAVPWGAFIGHWTRQPGLAWMCNWTTSGSLLAYQGHGIPEWRNNADFFKFFIYKNGKILDLVDYKRLVPKGGILCKEKMVTIVDGTSCEFDLVIMSTGYKSDSPFLPQRYSKVGPRQRYKMIFDVEDPTIAFVGFVRPVLGSVVTLSELNARWVAKVFSGKVSLKTAEERREEAKQEAEFGASTSKTHHSTSRVLWSFSSTPTILLATLEFSRVTGLSLAAARGSGPSL